MSFVVAYYTISLFLPSAIKGLLKSDFFVLQGVTKYEYRSYGSYVYFLLMQGH